MKTRDATARFVAAKAVRWSLRTKETALLHLGRFANNCPKLPSKPEPIEAFLASIPGATYRWNHYRTLRNFYNWLMRRKVIRRNPMESVEAPPKPEHEPYFLEENELVRLLTHPGHSQRDRALLFLLADTGARIGEAHNMRVGDIHSKAVSLRGKTGPRLVPVNTQVIQMLTALIPDGASPSLLLWRGLRGPLTVKGMERAVSQAFRRAGFYGERMSPHRLRHTFATLWDGPDAEGQAIGGWKTAEMWQRYHHLRQQRMASEHRRHSPVITTGVLD